MSVFDNVSVEQNVQGYCQKSHNSGLCIVAVALVAQPASASYSTMKELPRSSLSDFKFFYFILFLFGLIFRFILFPSTYPLAKFY